MAPQRALPSSSTSRVRRRRSADRRRVVRIGRLSARLEGADLLYLRLRDTELVRRVAVRVRDTSWGTVPAEVRSSTVHRDRDGDRVQIDVDHHEREIDFRWHGTIAPDGRNALIYEMDGRARADFLSSRIGICVLHPPAVSVGRPYRAWTSDGPAAAGFLPELVGPQMIVDGRVFALFPPFDRLEIDATPSICVAFEFEGDLFEMEDQRNWTDGSFKTYSTPLSMPFPFSVEEAQRFRQRVRIEVREDRLRVPLRRPDRTGRTPELELTRPLGTRVPEIGLALDLDGRIPDTRETGLLRGLSPAYLHADVLLGGRATAKELERAARVAAALDVPLELAVTLTGTERASREAVKRLRRHLDGLTISRLLVFHDDESATSASRLVLVRDVLEASVAGIPIVGGTSANFAELNRSRPDPATVDGLAFSVTPQAHDIDAAALVQSLEGQRDAVRTARSFSDGLPVHVGAVTLKPRPSRDALTLDAGTAGADERQSSRFAAAWTAASAKALIEAGAASVTFFESTGARGVLERTAVDGSLEPQVFPVYHVLRELASWHDLDLVGCTSSRPLEVEAIVAGRAGSLRALVANLTARTQHVTLRGLRATAPQIGFLGEEGFAASRPIDRDMPLRLELPAHAVARVAG